MSALELALVLVTAVALAVGVGLAAPHFLRGFREARERRGVDLNIEHRVEQELAEEEARDEEWRRRIDDQLEAKLDEWREEPRFPGPPDPPDDATGHDHSEADR